MHDTLGVEASITEAPSGGGGGGAQTKEGENERKKRRKKNWHVNDEENGSFGARNGAGGRFREGEGA